MKTNQIMSVYFKYGTLNIGHLDRMGDLNQVFDMGNRYRLNNGLSARFLQEWLRMHSTMEFVALIEKQIRRKALTTKRGRLGGTSAHLYVLLDAAAYLSPEFKLEVYSVFVDQRLLERRDDSGDEFIDLNASLALCAQAVLGKDSHKGHYIALANAIKHRVLNEGEAWNNTTPDKLIRRAEIERYLSVCLKNNLVRDWEHLKELAGKV